jgi:hypothetical protein
MNIGYYKMINQDSIQYSKKHNSFKIANSYTKGIVLSDSFTNNQ